MSTAAQCLPCIRCMHLYIGLSIRLFMRNHRFYIYEEDLAFYELPGAKWTEARGH